MCNLLLKFDDSSAIEKHRLKCKVRKLREHTDMTGRPRDPSPSKGQYGRQRERRLDGRGASDRPTFSSLCTGREI